MSSLKEMIIWGSPLAPNPLKCEIILLELGLPYRRVDLGFDEVKKPDFESKNPNGRLPALEDANTGYTLWESGAIIQYLIDMYDKDRKFSHASGSEKYQEWTWLHFQMSGQGPYWGQFVWFSFFHSERFPSAIERYKDEVKRVVMVLDRELKNKDYLVGGRLTYADLVFAPWNWVIFMAFEDFYRELESDYPSWKAWTDRLQARPSVQSKFQERLAAFNKRFKAHLEEQQRQQQSDQKD